MALGLTKKTRKCFPILIDPQKFIIQGLTTVLKKGYKFIEEKQNN